MTRIAPVTLDSLEASTRITLEAFKAKVGMLPNLYTTLANAPAALNGYLALNEALVSGVLTPQQREIVALATGQSNQCQYCVSAHSLIGKGTGLSSSAILAAREGRGDNAEDRAIAILVGRLIETRGVLKDSDITTAHEAGLKDAHIIEIVAHVALNTLTNFTNNVAQTEIDFPIVPLTLQQRVA